MISHTMRNHALAGLLTAGLLICSARAENWPQWRGPHLDGSSESRDLPDRLDASTQLWSAPLPGPGAGTPIVWGDRIFLTGLDDNSKKLLAMCISRRDGSMLWKKEVGQGFIHNERNNMAAPSAITDGKLAWFYYGSGDLVALDMEGNQKWARNIEKDYGPFHMNWIYGSSPLLYDGKLYVQVLHRDVPVRGPRDNSPGDSYLLAIDPQTGKDIWRVVRPNDALEESKESYSTPIPTSHDGKGEILLIGGDCVTASDAKTGKELWRVGGWDTRRGRNNRTIPSLVAGDGLVFACPSRNQPVCAIKDGGSGDVSKTNVAWKDRQLVSDVCVPLLYNGHLYVLDGDRKTLSCLEPSTGKVLWSGSLGGRAVFRASPTGADGKIYCMNEGGEVWVLAADQFKVLSQGSLGGRPSRASIAVVDGEVLIRAGDKLYAFGNKNKPI